MLETCAKSVETSFAKMGKGCLISRNKSPTVFLLNFLDLLINIQVLAARPTSPEGYTAWEIIHLEDSIRYGTFPNFSKIHESLQDHHVVYDQDHSFGTKLLQSSPGCPEPFESAPWVYRLVGEEPQPKCYLAGYQGPCSTNMKLYAQSSSFYGYCDCSCKQYFGYQVNIPRSYCIGFSEPEGHSRIMAFDRESDACQILFEQGSCKKKDWMVFGDDPTQGPICESRKCPSHPGENFVFYDFKTRECHRVGEKCNVDQKPGLQHLINDTDPQLDYSTEYNWLRYSYTPQENSWIPECQIDESHQQIQYNYYASKIRNLECKKYERFSSVLTRCVPVISMRFGLG